MWAVVRPRGGARCLGAFSLTGVPWHPENPCPPHGSAVAEQGGGANNPEYRRATKEQAMIHRLFTDVLSGLSLLTCGGWATPTIPNKDSQGDNRTA